MFRGHTGSVWQESELGAVRIEHQIAKKSHTFVECQE